MKEFPFIDTLSSLSETYNLKRTSILFFISLIAHYHESQRIKGKIIDLNISADKATYKISLSETEIRKKFGFSIDTIIKIKNELRTKIPISIKSTTVLSEKRKYKRYEKCRWAPKYLNYDVEYNFWVSREGSNIIYIPIKIIYDKKLTYSEKLAIIWNFSLHEKYGRKPKLREIERESSISERTIRKAKKKYPKFFMN